MEIFICSIFLVLSLWLFLSHKDLLKTPQSQILNKQFLKSSNNLAMLDFFRHFTQVFVPFFWEFLQIFPAFFWHIPANSCLMFLVYFAGFCLIFLAHSHKFLPDFSGIFCRFLCLFPGRFLPDFSGIFLQVLA